MVVTIRNIVLVLLFPLYAIAQGDTLWEGTEGPLETDGETGEIFQTEEIAPYHAPPLPDMAARPIEKDAWDKATGKLDYSKDVPEPPKEESMPQGGPSFDGAGWTAATQQLGLILQGLAIAIAVAGIAYGIYRMLKAPRNRQIARDGVTITLDNLEEYLHETDLDRFLKEALAKEDYAQAIRLYYLQVIKSLSAKNAIKWSPEKTNRDYLRETREHRLGGQFREATLVYERTWYGNQVLTGQHFIGMEPQFKNLLAAIG